MTQMLDFMQVALDYSSLGLSPVALAVGPLELRWYSLAYIAGILFAWWYLGKLIAAGDAPYTKPQIDDFITWSV
ncbi:MAG: prolipoprotein diacylglyceryl transferase family protein, partial [Polymorphobacter sp.]